MFKINQNTAKSSLAHRASTFATSTTLLLGVLTGTTLSLGASVLFPAMGVAQESEQFLVSQNSAVRATSAQEETLYLNNNRVYAYNLTASEGGTIGGITIPAGATIVGRYEPAEGGLRYVAEAVVYDNYSYNLNAASEVIEDVKDPRDTSAGAIAGDAGIGAAAGTVLGEVFGDASVPEIVGGAAAGAAVGNITAERVVVIEPSEPITLYSY